MNVLILFMGGSMLLTGGAIIRYPSYFQGFAPGPGTDMSPEAAKRAHRRQQSIYAIGLIVGGLLVLGWGLLAG
jgi:hypothetical protein